PPAREGRTLIHSDRRIGDHSECARWRRRSAGSRRRRGRFRPGSRDLPPRLRGIRDRRRRPRQPLVSAARAGVMSAPEKFGGFFHFFGKGDFKGLVLHLLEERPMHGYEIIKAIEERYHGFYKPSAGAIYPALRA